MVGTSTARVGVLLVVLLVALGGCSGTGGTDTTGTSTNNSTVTPTTDAGTPESSGTTGQSGSSNQSTDSLSYVTGENLTRGELTARTAEAVEAAGSYRLESTALYSVSSSDRPRSRANATVRVNLTADRGVRDTNRSVRRGNTTRFLRTTVYTDGNSTAWRVNTSGGARYGSGTADAPSTVSPVDTRNYSQNYTGLTGGFHWERNGTATVDNYTTARYSITGVANTDVLRVDANATLTNVTGTLLVDRDGVVRRSDLRYTIVGANSTATISLSTTLVGVGSTAVPEPAWTEAATQS